MLTRSFWKHFAKVPGDGPPGSLGTVCTHVDSALRGVFLVYSLLFWRINLASTLVGAAPEGAILPICSIWDALDRLLCKSNNSRVYVWHSTLWGSLSFRSNIHLFTVPWCILHFFFLTRRHINELEDLPHWFRFLLPLPCISVCALLLFFVSIFLSFKTLSIPVVSLLWTLISSPEKTGSYHPTSQPEGWGCSAEWPAQINKIDISHCRADCRTLSTTFSHNFK